MKKLILFATALGLALVWLRMQEASPFLDAPPGVIAAAPVQTETTLAPFSFNDYGLRPHSFHITPRASYDVSGRVLHMRRYYSDKYQGDLIPFDLALGWGAMSDNLVLAPSFVFEHRADAAGGRFLWMNWRLDENGRITPPPYPVGDPMQLIANNHVIPANKQVFHELRALRAGDLVRLKGYLVDVKDPQRPGWEWKSSMTRTDTSTHWGGNNTSCETFFVTEVGKVAADVKDGSGAHP